MNMYRVESCVFPVGAPERPVSLLAYVRAPAASLASEIAAKRLSDRHPFLDMSLREMWVTVPVPGARHEGFKQTPRGPLLDRLPIPQQIQRARRICCETPTW